MGLVKAATPDETPGEVDARYQRFTFCGKVSFLGLDDATPVVLLRDTGAAQSFIHEGVFLLSEKTFPGSYALYQGLDKVWTWGDSGGN